MIFFFFFFNDTATTEIYTLSLHDALPICTDAVHLDRPQAPSPGSGWVVGKHGEVSIDPPDESCHRSEEHTSELQSRQYLVCRLLLEKKKKNIKKTIRNNRS